jgi:hypothetical protein
MPKKKRPRKKELAPRSWASLEENQLFEETKKVKNLLERTAQRRFLGRNNQIDASFNLLIRQEAVSLDALLAQLSDALSNQLAASEAAGEQITGEEAQDFVSTLDQVFDMDWIENLARYPTRRSTWSPVGWRTGKIQSRSVSGVS